VSVIHLNANRPIRIGSTYVGITDTSDPGHFGTSLVGPNCPDRSTLVPKFPNDSSDLSADTVGDFDKITPLKWNIGNRMRSIE